MYKYTIHIIITFLIIILVIAQIFIFKKIRSQNNQSISPTTSPPTTSPPNKPKEVIESVSKFPTNYSTKVLSVPAIMNFRSDKSIYDPKFDGTIPVTPDDFLFYNSSRGEGAFSVVVDGTYTFNFSTDGEIVNQDDQNTFTPNDRTYMYLVAFADNENPLIMNSVYVYKKKNWSIENVRLFAGTVYRITICYDTYPFTKIHCPDLKVQVNVVIPTNLLTCDIKERKVDINPEWCNVMVMDPWEIHARPALTNRYGVVLSRVSKFIDMMRSRGSTIVWCMSDRFYKGQKDSPIEEQARNNLKNIPPTPFNTNYRGQYGDGTNSKYITLSEINMTSDGYVPIQDRYWSFNPNPLMNIDPKLDYLGDEGLETSYRIYTLSKNKRLVYVGVALDQCLLTTRKYSIAYFTGYFPNVVLVDLTDYSGALDPALMPDVVSKGVYSRKDVFKYIYRKLNKDAIVHAGIYDENTLGD